MFDLAAVASKKPLPDFTLDRVRGGVAPLPPAQTNAKARLVEEYLRRFQIITKGGLYIDGFSGAQSPAHEEAWTAKRVLELEPKRIRRVWLCEQDEAKLPQLRGLQMAHARNPRWREVTVLTGDFNRRVDQILMGNKIPRMSAVFVFLDQHSTECQWATVERLANHRPARKFEMLYFIGSMWLLRALSSARRPERLAQFDAWWGGPGWRDLIGGNQTDIVSAFIRRFREELGYEFVKGYPIRLREDEKTIAFHLIHASYHEQAPQLMAQAYMKVCGDRPGMPGSAQREMPF